MKDKIQKPFLKIGGVVYDHINRISIVRIGVETSVLLVIILILAML